MTFSLLFCFIIESFICRKVDFIIKAVKCNLQGITVRLGTVSAGAIRFMSLRNKYGRTLVNPNFCSADTWS